MGCPRIADQINLAFGTSINKDVVRRILAAHYHPSADGSGPSWFSFIGHVKDSLHSLDLFRCESMARRTHWVLVVMDQHTRRIIRFGIHAGDRGWARAVSDVQSSNPMACESEGPRRDGNQNSST